MATKKTVLSSTNKPAWAKDLVDKQALEKILDEKIAGLVDKKTFEEKVTHFKDEVMNRLDAVMGELKAIGEEQAIMADNLSTKTN